MLGLAVYDHMHVLPAIVMYLAHASAAYHQKRPRHAMQGEQRVTTEEEEDDDVGSPPIPFLRKCPNVVSGLEYSSTRTS